MGARTKQFQRVECNIDPYTVAEQTKLPGILRNLSPDMVHFRHSQRRRTLQRTKVVTVHDLTLIDFDTSRGSLASDD